MPNEDNKLETLYEFILREKRNGAECVAETIYSIVKEQAAAQDWQSVGWKVTRIEEDGDHTTYWVSVFGTFGPGWSMT